MRAGAVIVLLGITAWGAYSVGRQRAPANNPPSVAATPIPKSDLAKPVAFAAPALHIPERVPASSSSSGPAPSSNKVNLPQNTEPAGVDAKPPVSNIKRKVEIGLAAAAIAAIIVQRSRAEYHAGGRPCACPDDTMRNGRACGARSAYSLPGGASPLCYPTDVTAAMIELYRQRAASR